MAQSDEYREILSRLEAILAAGTAPPAIDPTANVLSLVSAAMKRQDDLRQMEAGYQAQLAMAESRRIDALNLAESRRVDARLGAQEQQAALATEKLTNTATTLAAQVVATAEAMRASVAATAEQTSELIGVLRDSHDKRITELEQNRYQLGGRDIQRDQGRQGSQWATGQVLTVAAALLAAGIALFALLR
jgi:hypothetical protein